MITTELQTHPDSVFPPSAAQGPAFAGLRPEQAEVAFAERTPLLVAAGAGSGKTSTLAARVAALVLAGADPQRILLLSFARRAAAMLERRVGQTLHEALRLPASSAAPRLHWCGTFHSVAARLLRMHAGALGLAESFSVLDRGDAEELMGLVRQRLGLHRSAQRFPLPATCSAILSRVVNRGLDLAPVLQQHYPWCEAWVDELRGLFAAYTEEKLAQQLLDYDDLLLYWHLALEEPAVAPLLRKRFDHVLVDEYQDTNALQQRIVRALAPQGRGLVVVGDDAQAIYSFRGAEPAGLLHFCQQFEPPAALLALQHNHRSTPQILAAAQAVIEQASQRLPKVLRAVRGDGLKPQLVHVADEAAEATWVADNVLQQREQGLALRRQAVLFRTGTHSAALELELARRRIPFRKYGGLRFLEAAHLKDVLALLQWAHNPRGQLAGLRAARLVPGFGPAHARRVVEAVAQAADPLQALASFEPPARSAPAWQAWSAIHQRLARGELDWPEQLHVVLAWYRPQLERLYADARVRELDLQALSHLAAGHGSCQRFLAEMAIDPPEASSDESGDPSLDDDYLVLSTIHAAKGQEWAAVNVLRVVDGCMPADLATGSAAEIEEERRLLYVAMTRARDQLALLMPQRFHVTEQHPRGDRHLYGGLSRFVTPEVLQHCEVLSARAVAPDVGADGDGAGCPRVDLAARARARWLQPGSGEK